jgi:pantetheine-phosphate adenylyltransferase
MRPGLSAEGSGFRSLQAAQTVAAATTAAATSAAATSPLRRTRGERSKNDITRSILSAVSEPSSARNTVRASIAVYPGSFDPMTNGHLDILERASPLFERVIVAVGQHEAKSAFFSPEQRCELIAASVGHLSNIEVAHFDGLVVNFCRQHGARVLIRGLRAASDFETEFRMGLANRDLAPGVETVFLIPHPAQMFVSSSLVREIAGHGGNFERYVPPPVAVAVLRRLGKS